MATRRSPAPARTGLPHGIPAELPDDGTPFTIQSTTTHRKQIGDPTDDGSSRENKLSVEDLQDADWHIYTQGSAGFEYLDVVPGRPEDIDVRNMYGAGRYKSVPEGPKGGKLKEFAQYHKIVDLQARDEHRNKPAEDTEKWKDPSHWGGRQGQEGDMPAWMIRQSEKDAEERAEARRVQMDAAAKDQEHRRLQEKREWEKREREERETAARRASEAKDRAERYERERIERKEKEQSEREERTYRADQMQHWVKAAGGIVTALIANKAQEPQGNSMNETLLQLLINSNKQAPAQVAPPMDLNTHLDLLIKLDTLRAPKMEAPEVKSDFDKAMEVAAVAGPALAGMMQSRSQAKLEAAALAAGISPEQIASHSQNKPRAALAGPREEASNGAGSGGEGPDLEAMGRYILANPELISKIAMEDPDKYADSLSEAVKGTPALQAAVIKKFNEQ